MRYGYFDDEAREYVIERPDTPMSWVNYLGTDQYCAIVSNNAAGYAFHRSPKSGRLLRFRFNSVPMDRPGRYFYLRDAEDGDYWSLSWQPVAKPLDQARYVCAHGAGVTRFESSYKGIEGAMRAFVPVGENAEVWEVTLTNKDSRPRKLGLFGYAEWCFWHMNQDAFNFQYILYTCRMGLEDGIVDYTVRLWPFEEPKAFFASSLPITSFDTDREVFLGGYRHEGQPLSVERGRCFDSVAVGGTPCGALHSDIELQPGETLRAVFVIGVGDAKTKGRELRERFSAPGAVDAELERVRAYWDERLSSLTLETPSPEVNSVGNIWNQIQCHTTFNWSRAASFNEAGGRDGLGFRDTAQDTLGVVHAIPELVKGKLTDLLKAQYSFGAAMHHVQPLEWKQGPHNVAAQHFSDDHLWLLLAIPAYIRETGDFAWLDELVPYADEGRASVYDHLKRAIDFSWSKRGPHGLCLGLAADWNDCLNLRGQGETMFSSFLLLRGLRELIALAERLPNTPARKHDLEQYGRLRDKLLATIAEHAWDGDWFLRGYLDSGRKLGSHESQGSTIFLNAQSWAVLADAAPRDLLVRAMDSVHEHLATPHGIVLNSPSYTEHDAEVGAITTFPGGLKENGGIFCHANTWAVIAEAELGRGDKAFELYRSFLPAAKNDTADLHSMEPYAFAQFVTGKDHPHRFGRARNSWLTGTATWAFVSLTQHILGVRADYDGLVVAPVLPESWEGFRMVRKFRGATYEISVTQVAASQRMTQNEARSAQLFVDGVPLAGNKVPLAPAGSVVKVELMLGASETPLAATAE
jgi:N,N'-diacetylchitobiose phosphorylase